MSRSTPSNSRIALEGVVKLLSLTPEIAVGDVRGRASVPSGTVTAGASYNAYGQITAGGISGITPFGYAGGYTDPTGFIYLVNRYYDPSTGQFLSVDPLAGITGEPYQYVNGDPLNFTDPPGAVQRTGQRQRLGFSQSVE